MAMLRNLGTFAAPLFAACVVGCSAETDDRHGSLDCGECPDPTFGSPAAWGVASIDGVVEPANTLDTAVTRAERDFETSLEELEAIWDIDAEGRLADRVSALVAAIEADFGAGAASEASLTVQLTPRECSLNLEVAARAQADCEAAAGCMPEEGCAASAECEPQAAAQGNASMVCTPPAATLTLDVEEGADASTRAELQGKAAFLRIHGPLVLASFAHYQALIDGEVDGQVVFETPPLEAVIDSLQRLIDAGTDGSVFAKVPPGRLPCVLPALSTSATLLREIATKATTTLQAQGAFVTAFLAGFSGS